MKPTNQKPNDVTADIMTHIKQLAALDLQSGVLDRLMSMPDGALDILIALPSTLPEPGASAQSTRSISDIALILKEAKQKLNALVTPQACANVLSETNREHSVGLVGEEAVRRLEEIAGAVPA